MNFSYCFIKSSSLAKNKNTVAVEKINFPLLFQKNAENMNLVIQNAENMN